MLKNKIKQNWIIILLTILLILISILISSSELKGYHLKLFNWIYNVSFIPKFIWIMISTMGDAIFIITYVLIIAIIFSFQKRTKEAKLLVLVMLIGHLIKWLIGYIKGFPRPGVNIIPCGDFNLSSFPSGHVFAITLLLGTLYLFKPFNNSKLYLSVISIFIILMCVSRVYLGCHWPMDVIGGVILALIIVLITKKIYKA